MKTTEILQFLVVSCCHLSIGSISIKSPDNMSASMRCSHVRPHKKQRQFFQSSHLADTMTASPSLHRSAGIDFRHCLDRRKRPGKNTDPAARMVSMVPGKLSQR